MDADHIVLVGTALLVGHAHVGQFLAGSLQAGSRRVIADDGIFQIIHPLLDRCLCHLVDFVELCHDSAIFEQARMALTAPSFEVVDYQQEVLREDLVGQCHVLSGLTDIALFLLVVEAEHGTLLRHARERGHAVVGIVIATAEVEVQDVDGVDLLDDAVVLADADLVGNAPFSWIWNPAASNIGICNP